MNKTKVREAGVGAAIIDWNTMQQEQGNNLPAIILRNWLPECDYSISRICSWLQEVFFHKLTKD